MSSHTTIDGNGVKAMPMGVHILFSKKSKNILFCPAKTGGGKGASAPSCPPLLTPMAMPGQLMYPNLGSFT